MVASREARESPVSPASNCVSGCAGKAAVTSLLTREPPDPTPVRSDAAADLGAAGADRLTDDGGRSPLGEERAQHGRNVRECRWSSRSGGDSASRRRGFMRRDRSDKNFVPSAVYRCRMLPSLDAKTSIPVLK